MQRRDQLWHLVVTHSHITSNICYDIFTQFNINWSMGKYSLREIRWEREKIYMGAWENIVECDKIDGSIEK